MKYLITRELRKDSRDMIVGTLAMVCPFLVVVLLYILLNDKTGIIGEYIFSLPVEVYRMLGFPVNPGEYNMQFYGNVYLMLANIVIVISFCYRVCNAIERDEYDGSIFFLCNQLFSRREMILGKYIGTVIGYIIQYTIMIVTVYVTEYALDMESIKAGSLFAGGFGLLSGGICIGVLYISVFYAFCVYDSKKEDAELGLFAGTVTFGLLLVGNIHRIIMVIALILSKSHADLADKLRGAGKLKFFRNISPLSQLNPNNNYSADMWIKVCVISLVLSGAFLILTVYLYDRRHIEKV